MHAFAQHQASPFLPHRVPAVDQCEDYDYGEASSATWSCMEHDPAKWEKQLYKCC